ncbi:MAG: endo-1,4-beta-xylanase [Pirellulales bacterium]|nr:endo-1,4-beta-xylanase [Pirellulales bacterium]
MNSVNSQERYPILTAQAWLCLAAATLAGRTAGQATADETRALKELYADKFRVGVALSTSQVLGEQPEALALAARQYNAITPENLLKWAEVHPEPEKYEFGPADAFVEFGQRHGMFIVGHTLTWHNQTPAWVFEDDAGQPLSRGALLARLRAHIHAVVGRYQGRIHGWDVVNEAFEDDGALRDTPWRRIIGDDYLEQAFRFAHEADPKAELYYNDYNEWHPGKRRAVSQFVRSLKARGVRIDGIGLQGHWGMSYPLLDEVEATLSDYGKLGVKLLITELDINVLPRSNGQTAADVAARDAAAEELNPYAEGLPPEVDEALADRYASIFRLFLKHADKIDRVTFWGVHDGQSWLNNWPIRGRTAYPLLFDRRLQPKLAFEKLAGLAAPARQ